MKQGELALSDGSVYHGSWTNDKQHGYGEITYGTPRRHSLALHEEIDC